MAIWHCYWHLVVKNGNFTLLLTSNDLEWQYTHCYWHLVVKKGNFTLLLTTSGREWQFHTATEIYWSRCLGTQIWQMNLLWPMNPQHLLARLVLGRWTFFSQWTPTTRAEMPWIPVHNTWQMNLLCPMEPPKVTGQRCLHTATDI